MSGSPGDPVPASVLVVSHHRLSDLRRCLDAIAQLDHPNFEVVVVADSQAVAALGLLADRIKLIPFDAPNISAARNLALAQAAGPVVAFIDDDAVPEPTWLSRLVAPFAQPDVAAATGFVRGRNGISYQWRAATVDRFGADAALDVPGDRVSLHGGDAARAVKTHGTNMAFRRSAVLAAGGFDPAIRFYLDEAGVTLRLAAAGLLTAVVPMAQVHHGFAESARRRADRAPLSLHEIGASAAVFLRRHAADADPSPHLDTLRAAQRARLVRMMVRGLLEPRDVRRLLAGLEAGLAEGAARPLPALAPLADSPPAFRPYPGTGPRRGVVLPGWSWRRRGLAAVARAAVADGAVTTVFRFSPSALFHRMRFDDSGYWVQTGGVAGRSDRAQPLVRLWRFRDRLRAETARIAPFRPTGPARD